MAEQKFCQVLAKFKGLISKTIPGFGDKTFKVKRSVTETILRQVSETTYVEEHSQSFMAKTKREGAMYAEPVEWVSPTGESIYWKIGNHSKNFYRNNLGEAATKKPIKFLGSPRFPENCFLSEPHILKTT